MNSLALLATISGGESCSFISGSRIHVRKDVFGFELLKSPFRGISGDWLKHLQHSRGGSGYRLSVTARIKKAQKHDYPWPDNLDPNIESGHLSYLSHFKPLKEKPKPVTLPFEKPLLDLEKKIIDVSSLFLKLNVFSIGLTCFMIQLVI